MGKTFQVTWAATAHNDLKQIIDHIALDSPDDALRILKEVRQRASDLSTLPERGRIVPELHAQGISIYRELVVPPWRMIYRIAETSVFVLSVIDSRRNVEDILLERLIK